jgi:hypothetical protein
MPEAELPYLNRVKKENGDSEGDRRISLDGPSPVLTNNRESPTPLRREP